MSEASEKMIKRSVILADNRYLIFYTFAPSDDVDPSPADAELRAKPERPDEEN